jgi:hypothetical protein
VMGYYLCIVFWGLAFVLLDYVSLPERGRNLSPGLAIAASASSIPLRFGCRLGSFTKDASASVPCSA